MKMWVVNFVFVGILIFATWLLVTNHTNTELKKEVPTSPAESYQVLPK